MFPAFSVSLPCSGVQGLKNEDAPFDLQAFLKPSYGLFMGVRHLSTAAMFTVYQQCLQPCLRHNSVQCFL